MKKFMQNLLAALTALGMKDKFDKKELTAEDQAALIEAYNKAQGDGSFEKDSKEFLAEQEREREQARISATFTAAAEALGIAPEAAKTPEGQATVLAAIGKLQETVTSQGATIEKLAGQAGDDKPEAVVKNQVIVTGAHTSAHAFGIEHDFFATTKRYNRIMVNGRIDGVASRADRDTLEADFGAYCEGLTARYAELHKAGLIPGIRKGSVDLTELNSDTEIGTRQFNIRRDMVIARIVQLPTLAGIFDTVSNIQSGEILTNVIFSEISQAYQAGEVFKGDVKFTPEKAVVDDAMVKVRFPDMKSLEKSYLNYLNREGSDPVKWTLIEWIVLEMAKKVANERNSRAILGCRVEPVASAAGPANFASTGVVWRLIKLYEAHKLNPFKDSVLASYTKSTIGDVMIAFMEKVKLYQPDLADQMVLYANKTHLPMFKEWYRSKYGKDTDFDGVEFKVPNHETKIVWVPNMGNLKLLVATVPGNIELLQNVPGEEYDFKFERHLEEVLSYSYWKEGAGVTYAGKEFASLALLEANNFEGQWIFMNWPAIAASADEATPAVKNATTSEDLGFLITTGANTTGTGDAGADVPVSITDIVGAKAGVVYRIECGSTTNASKIAKSGKFSELTAAWEPDAVGKYLEVYYNPTTSKFIEVARG
jgi:hypothetical protein